MPEDGGGDTFITRVTKVTVPNWIQDNRTALKALAGVSGALVAFARNPVKFILDEFRPWIVERILALWGMFLGYMAGLWDVIAAIPRVAIYQPVATAFALPGSAIQDTWQSIGASIIEASQAAGPLAPFVVVAAWGAIGVLAAATISGLISFVGTYLPLRSIPVVRRFA